MPAELANLQQRTVMSANAPGRVAAEDAGGGAIGGVIGGAVTVAVNGVR